MALPEHNERKAVGLTMTGQAVQRSRVLVVRNDLLRDRVAAALEGARIEASVEVSPSYLSAMGWLANERVDAVIGPVSAMAGMVGATARALRKLAPGTRLIAVASDNERAEAGAALSAGFDECVYEPADATTLLASLRLFGGDMAKAHDHGHAAPEHDEGAADHGPTVEDGDPTTVGDSMPEDWLLYGTQPARTLDEDGPVGDVDLAEAVMRGDGTLLPMAVRLLREQSGLHDVSFVLPDEGGHARGASAEVGYGGLLFGVLESPGADEGTLESWAAWLSRWVALDRRQSGLYGMAMRDKLTGLWNRRYFDRFLDRLLDHAGQGRQQVTLLVFDIDDFKQYNDKYGHPAGDEILKSAADLIQSLVREHDVVARIGGDEFAAVFWDKGEPRHLGSQHPDNVIGIAKRFQKAICEHRFPKLGEEAVGRLTVSGGLAGFPWDGRTPAELIERADANAIASKRQGKNAICFGPGAAPNGNGGH